MQPEEKQSEQVQPGQKQPRKTNPAVRQRGLGKKSALSLGVGLAAVLVLSACGNADPLADEDSADQTDNGDVGENGDADNAIVVGSQQYYSNTIIAEIYAQVLEDAGYQVQREFEIGQREVYLPELESGAIDVFPEYTGNLLQYLDDDSVASTAEEIESDLASALPSGLTALEPASATDQDSYVVTAEFAQQHGLSSVDDLAGIEDLRIAANSEFEARPYGPEGMEETYGVQITLVPVEDSGGPLTVRALVDGDVEVADIYSADPSIEANDLVILEDPENLVLPQNIVPLVSENVSEEARDTLNQVSEALDQETLLALNARSVDDQESAETIVADWLEQTALLD